MGRQDDQEDRPPRVSESLGIGWKGKEAMAARSSMRRLSQLWQFPSLVLSIGLFAVAAYLFINPARRATIDDKIAVAEHYLQQDRPDAALEQLNAILDTESSLAPYKEGMVHLLLGEALEAGQKQLKLDVPENDQRIIQQTDLALAGGVVPDAAIHRRLGNAYASLGHFPEAIQNYRDAITIDPDHGVDLRRKLIELELDGDQASAASDDLDDYLKQKELTAAERSWALGAKAQLLIDQHQFAPARTMLAEALKLNTDTVAQGQFNYQLGYCAWKQGDGAEAERYLRLARDQLKPSHPLDGNAAYVLGRIYQDRRDPATANSFYRVTLEDHPESEYGPLARLGRGVCSIMLGDSEGGLQDMHDLAADISARSSRAVLKAEAIDGFNQAADILGGQEKYQAALEVMDDQRQLLPKPGAVFYARMGNFYEKRASQIEQSIADAPAAEQIRRTQETRDTRDKAGDAFMAYSHALTMTDDKGYGEALWHAIDLYDAAGDLPRVISSLELFATERPQDVLAPDALLRLGTAYQAAGLFDKAINAFQRNQFMYPKSLAASKSAVPLAEAYVARGPQDYPQAEKVLLNVVDTSNFVDPGAEEFRQSLFELAQLYYRTQRFELAIARLDEMAQRYPNDPQMPQLTFLMADSYRKSASLLATQLATTANGAAGAAEVETARRERLAKARELFDKAVDLYGTSPPTSDVDKLYLKLSCFYRADCMYDLGKYEEAIKLYDQAAFRYQDDPSALAAYVQIVNSYCALGKSDDARAANERAKWILTRMPPEAFQNDSFSMPKKYWDDWLKWTSQSGVF
jgi:tetratricopeptide (TPR) repeat protein